MKVDRWKKRLIPDTVKSGKVKMERIGKVFKQLFVSTQCSNRELVDSGK